MPTTVTVMHNPDHSNPLKRSCLIEPALPCIPLAHQTHRANAPDVIACGLAFAFRKPVRLQLLSANNSRGHRAAHLPSPLPLSVSYTNRFSLSWRCLACLDVFAFPEPNPKETHAAFSILCTSCPRMTLFLPSSLTALFSRPVINAPCDRVA